MKLRYWLYLSVVLQLILIVILAAWIRFEMNHRLYVTHEYFMEAIGQGDNYEKGGSHERNDIAPGQSF